MGHIYICVFCIFQNVLSHPIGQTGKVFQKGQQHDCSEFVQMVLYELCQLGLHKPCTSKWENHCLGPVCGNKEVLHIPVICGN